MNDRAGRLMRVTLTVAALLFSVACSGPDADTMSGPEDVGSAGDLAPESFDPGDTQSDGAEFHAPDDDPSAWAVDSSLDYEVLVSQPRWVVPSAGLPAQAVLQSANNNLDIVFHEERLYLAFRTAPAHFADPSVRMVVVSSLDNGVTWEFERDIALGSDVREPRFLSLNGDLQLFFFEAGALPFEFQPKKMWKTRRLGPGDWSDLEVMVDAPVVPWDVKTRAGRAYMTSYQGNHYEVEALPEIEVYFDSSLDGDTWTRVEDVPFVYKGGVSEVAFEFDEDGSLWMVTRNEDGDETGFGSHVCYAPADGLGQWDCGNASDPERYDSPELFRHGKDIYLAARRDVGGPYDEGLTDLTYEEQKGRYLLDYSLRPKRFALYRLNKEERKIEHLMDLPGVGDTAFASVRRTGPHTFLLANYTSPLEHEEYTWLEGQVSPEGTQIYFLEIEFRPVN